MPENRNKVAVYNIEYICDKCGVGNMIFKNIVLTSNPPKYPHKCIHCGNEQILLKQYPALEYEFEGK